MRKIFTAVFLCLMFSAFAAAPPRGHARLRELVIFPEMNLNFNFGLNFQGDEWVVGENVDLLDEISRLREELKRQPDDIKQLLRLGNLLDNNGETNESRVCYQKAEQLCRNRIAVSPQNGLALTDLGEALWELDKNEEAESVFRRAVLVSSNEWKCWIGLGNFLASEPFLYLFPKNLRDKIYSPTIPQEVLDYRPTPSALQKTENACKEASKCFDRAVALAPDEPKIFVQRAGYMSASNYQSCFFRNFRDNNKMDTRTLLSAFFSDETVVNLRKAAELSPKDYTLTSLAAYFAWFGAMIQANWPNVTSLTMDKLPDKTRQSILNAMTHLENLSEDSDKKAAAGALENLGMLNMVFGNKQAATANFRRAVSLDPTREQSWDLLSAMLLDSGSLDELLAVSESRLKANNSARNHLIQGKVCAKMGKWKEVNEQAIIAGKIETNNIIPPLLLAAAALKQSADTNQMTIAFNHLSHAKELLDAMPASDESQKRWRELMLDIAIAGGLQGSQDGQKLARQCLEAVLKHYPNDNDAKEILSAIGQP